MDARLRLADPVARQLRAIEANSSGERAARAVLRDGRALDRVLFCEWPVSDDGPGETPTEGMAADVPWYARELLGLFDLREIDSPFLLGPDLPQICASEVIAVEESPFRLPVQLANEAYQHGETGMGYWVFTLRLNDARELHYLADGPSVDFPAFPPDVTPEMIRGIRVHERNETTPSDCQGMAEFFYCYHSK